MRWFVGCLCLLCGCLASPVAAASTLTITAPQANVRAGPGLTYQVLTAVPQGAIFPMLASQTGWHQIWLEDGRKGWVATSAVRVDQGSRALSTVTPPVASAPLQPDGTSWAMVIGINTYQHPEIPALSYAVNDARSVAASGGDVRRDILHFSEPAGARKFRIESELHSGREARGKEWIQLRAGVSLERVAEALRALSR